MSNATKEPALKKPSDYPHIQCRPDGKTADLFDKVLLKTGGSRSELAARCLRVALPIIQKSPR